MKDSFTIVEPDGNSLSDIYGVTNRNLDVEYPTNEKSKFFKRLDCCVWTALTLLLIGVASFLAISYWPKTETEESKPETKSMLPLFANETWPDTSATKTDHRDATSESADLMMADSIQPALESENKSALNLADSPKLKYLIEPLNYEIYIRFPTNPDDQPSFNGKTSIVLMAKEEVKHIIIGAKDLRILSVSLTAMDATEETRKIYRTSIDSYDVDEGTLVIQVYEIMKPYTKYLLQIEYNGDVQNEPHGLFRLEYTLPGSENTKTLIGTNTEIPFARTIFPCFDLPAQTAIYNLNVCREPSMAAVSSSSLTKLATEPFSGCVWDTFSPTVSLPTRLFGFVISDYAFDRATTDHGITYTIWSPTKSNSTSYLADIIPKLLDTFDDYFGHTFPSSSVDIFCVPSVLPYIPSKMGIIIASDSDMTVSETEAFEYQKEKVAKMAAAHLAEQWLEFLITFDDQDRWIKEALVQYLQYVAVDEIKPNWRIFEEFFTSVLQPEMDSDILNPNQKQLHIQWISYLKRQTVQEPLYPIHETSVFKSHDNYWKVVHALNDDRVTDPAIYSELFAQRSIEKVENSARVHRVDLDLHWQIFAKIIMFLLLLIYKIKFL